MNVMLAICGNREEQIVRKLPEKYFSETNFRLHPVIERKFRTKQINIEFEIIDGEDIRKIEVICLGDKKLSRFHKMPEKTLYF